MAQSKYTPDQQVDAIVADLLADIRHAERQATEGPYYPELGISADSLRKYAQDCRNQLARIEAGRDNPVKTTREFIAGRI